MTRERRLPASRMGRLSVMGKLAGGLAGGILSEGARQLANGQRPSLSGSLLTPANMSRIGDRLSEMRGAAMKVGQLLSMDSGEVLPPEFSQMLARLREDAHQMPLGEVNQALKAAWGEGWDKQFERFDFKPMAAASIGQVHDARLRDGPRLAVKIQYPGVRRSIDSDVDNVATLLRVFTLLPEGLDVNQLLEQAKQQLHMEADYRLEARAIGAFAQRLDGDSRFELPAVIEELSNTDVLAMGYLDGSPIETLEDESRSTRNDVSMNLVELALREVFDWGLVQTDPNFANYLYAAEHKRIQLLDFGATRQYDASRLQALHTLFAACIDGGDDDIAAAAVSIGYLGDDDPNVYRDAIVALLRTATEPARVRGDYRFGSTDLAQRMSDIVVEMRVRNRFNRLPPTDILYLHRKLGGLYLLLSRLKATIPVHGLVNDVINDGASSEPRHMSA